MRFRRSLAGSWPILAGSIACACNPHPERHMGPGELEIVELWGTSRRTGGAQFESVHGMAVSPRGDVWVANGYEGNIDVLFETGRPRKTMRFQDNPGAPDFSPTRMSRYGDRIAVLGTRGSIHVLDANGFYLAGKPLEITILNPKGFATLADGSFVVSGGSVDSERALFLFDSTGHVLQAWHSIPEAADSGTHRSFSNARMVAGGPVSVTSEGALLYSEAAPHRILRFALPDTVGNLLAADVRLLPPIIDDFDVDREVGGEFVTLPRWNFPQSTGVFEMPDGRLLNVITIVEEHVSIWEVYEPDGTLVARRDLYRAYHPWDITADGRIVVSEKLGDRTRVGLVRLEIREDGA